MCIPIVIFVLESHYCAKVHLSSTPLTVYLIPYWKKGHPWHVSLGAGAGESGFDKRAHFIPTAIVPLHHTTQPAKVSANSWLWLSFPHVPMLILLISLGPG